MLLLPSAGIIELAVEIISSWISFALIYWFQQWF